MALTTLKEPGERAQWALLLTAPALGILVAWVFAPAPQGVDAARESVDRAELNETVSKKLPEAPQRFDAELGGRIRLVGVELPAKPLGRGKRFTIDTHWEVLKEMDRSWEMFVHIDLQSGRHRIHGDHAPTGGKYATTLWRKGEFVTDSWDHRVPLDAPLGTYDVFLGYYIDDERMPFTGGDKRLHAGDNRLKIGSLKIQ